MHIRIERSHLLKALGHGQNVIEKRNTIPILGNVMIKTGPDCLILTTTSMDMALVETIPAELLISGQTTVSAQLFYDIVRKLSDKSKVELSYNNQSQQLTIQAGRGVFNLPCLPVADFPQIPQENLPTHFKLPVDELKLLLNRTRFAMSADDNRFALNGIHFHTKLLEGDIVLRSVATDTHRLAYLETPLQHQLDDFNGIILGKKTVQELLQLLDDASGDVRISLSKTRVQFELASATLSSRLIEGMFPNYEAAIPQNNGFIMLVNTKDFFSAVDRIATVAHDPLSSVLLSIKDNKLVLSAVGSPTGEGTEELSINFPYDQTIDMAFNAKYLLDMGGQIDEEETEVCFADNNTPVLIKGAQDRRSTYVLMPVRV